MDIDISTRAANLSADSHMCRTSAFTLIKLPVGIAAIPMIAAITGFRPYDGKRLARRIMMNAPRRFFISL